MQGVREVVRAVLLGRCERHAYENMFVEFPQYADGALEVVILSILFKTNVESKTAPPDVALTKFWDTFSILDLFLLSVPLVIVLHCVLQYQVAGDCRGAPCALATQLIVCGGHFSREFDVCLDAVHRLDQLVNVSLASLGKVSSLRLPRKNK